MSVQTTAHAAEPQPADLERIATALERIAAVLDTPANPTVSAVADRIHKLLTERGPMSSREIAFNLTRNQRVYRTAAIDQLTEQGRVVQADDHKLAAK